MQERGPWFCFCAAVIFMPYVYVIEKRLRRRRKKLAETCYGKKFNTLPLFLLALREMFPFPFFS